MAVVTEQGQILETTEGHLLQSGGPFQKSLSGRNTIAKSSMPFSEWGASLNLTLIGGRPISFSEMYRTQPYVATAVDVLAQQVSRLPLKVYKRKSGGERERVYDHPVAAIVRNPYRRNSSSQLKQWMIRPMLLQGNSILAKLRAERYGPPTGLVPLDWRHLVPHAEKGEPVSFWTTTQFGERLFLDPEDLLHLMWEPPDGLVGVSPLQQLGVTLRIEEAAQRYQQSYLANSARPPSAIKQAADGKDLDEPMRAEIREDMQRIYGGPDNAGRPALLPAGLDWVSIAHDAREAELIAQRKLTREEVASVYKVPQPLMGILENATLANVQELHRMLYTTVLGPWLTLIEESFQAQVIDAEPAWRDEGLFVEFDLAEVLKGDKLKEIIALKTAVQSGLLTINEGRQVLNLPGFNLDWCKGPLIPANNLKSGPDAASSAADETAKAVVAALAAGNGNGH